MSCFGPSSGWRSGSNNIYQNAPHEKLRWEFCFSHGRIWNDLGTVMLHWKYLQWDQKKKKKKWHALMTAKRQYCGVKMGKCIRSGARETVRMAFDIYWRERDVCQIKVRGEKEFNTQMNLNLKLCRVNWGWVVQWGYGSTGDLFSFEFGCFSWCFLWNSTCFH